MRTLTTLVLCLELVCCGARTSLPEPDVATGGGGDASTSTSTGAPRSCAPDCTVGHRCCIGGCSGPAAQTPSDCCTCLPGEVSSMTCASHTCGN